MSASQAGKHRQRERVGDPVALGRNFGGAKNVTQRYDPVTNTWSYKAPMSTARYGMAAVAAGNGLIYVIGGATTPTLVQAYNPSTDTWTQ